MRNFINFPLALGALLASHALAQFKPNVPVDTRSLDEIYEAAQKEEGTLQVFAGGDAGFRSDPLRTAWAARFPNVKLNLTVDLSKYHDSRIDRAYFTGDHVADVTSLQTLHDFSRWKTENRLAYYKPPTFDDLLQSDKDLDGAYLPTGITSFGRFIYNPSLLPNSSLPSSYLDLVSPAFKSKLVLTYPHDDDAVAYLFSLIIRRYGLNWLHALAANDVQWVRGTAAPGIVLSQRNSTRALTFTSSGLPSNSSAVYGPNELRSVDPAPKPGDQFMSWAQSIAIVAGTPRLEMAKLYVAWSTSKERQAASGSGPSVLESLNKERGVDLYNAPQTQTVGFRLFEHDRLGVERWKNLFEDVLGTPQGVTPLDVYPKTEL